MFTLDDYDRPPYNSRVAVRILIIPDKFKGTLSASGAAEAIARGWMRARAKDRCELLPMSDGGDGFGEVISSAIGAKPQKTKTVNAARKSIEATWWWEPKKKIAIIESAKVVGLAMLPPGKFHPFELDTFGLGKVLQDAKSRGARVCLVGIGGSATNDGGFGLARSLGWLFLDASGKEIQTWTELPGLSRIYPPKLPTRFPKLIVAVDVKNKLLGAKGCSRTYGPQKGLRVEDFPLAERSLGKLSKVAENTLDEDFALVPGAGAAGGLGFGLMAFGAADCESGFAMFARYAGLEKQLRDVDLVITGEGAIDRQTLMGKGVGEIAVLCRRNRVPVIGLAGVVCEPRKAKRLFTEVRGLVDIVPLAKAKEKPARYLERLAFETAMSWNPEEKRL